MKMIDGSIPKHSMSPCQMDTQDWDAPRNYAGERREYLPTCALPERSSERYNHARAALFVFGLYQVLGPAGCRVLIQSLKKNKSDAEPESAPGIVVRTLQPSEYKIKGE